MNIIDLTLPINMNTADEAKTNLAKARSGHLGTHFDVMNKTFPLEYMELDAVVFDVSSVELDKDITEDDIDMNVVPENGFVAFHTGFIEEIGYGSREYFQHHPQLSMQLINKLLDKHVAIIAVDFAGMRNGKEHTPADQICADHGTFVVENICNLASILCGQKSAKFRASTYPVNFIGLTGLPSRVVARVE